MPSGRNWDGHEGQMRTQNRNFIAVSVESAVEKSSPTRMKAFAYEDDRGVIARIDLECDFFGRRAGVGPLCQGSCRLQLDLAPVLVEDRGVDRCPAQGASR